MIEAQYAKLKQNKKFAEFQWHMLPYTLMETAYNLYVVRGGPCVPA